MKLGNTADIRGFLIEQMVKTAEGKIEVGQAKAMCNFAQQIYNTVKLELQYAAMKEKGAIVKVEALTFAQPANNGKKNLRAA